MALKGHKRGCGCVGCSPKARRRGMAALKNMARKRRGRKNPGAIRALARGLGKVVRYSKLGNPIVPDWLTARRTAVAISKKEGRFYVARKAPGGYEIAPAQVSASRGAALRRKVLAASKANRGKAGRPFRAMRARVAKSGEKKRREYLLGKEESRRKLFGNPGQWRTIGKVEEASRAAKLAKALRKRTPMAETRIRPEIDGLYHVDARIKHGSHGNPRRGRRRNAPALRRRRNPSESGQQIGTAPSLTVAGEGALQFPRGILKTGPTPETVRLILGGSPAPRPGARVTRIEYDDPVKAVNAYKEIGRFRHDCEDPFIVGPSEGGSVLLASKSKAWQGD